MPLGAIELDTPIVLNIFPYLLTPPMANWLHLILYKVHTSVTFSNKLFLSSLVKAALNVLPKFSNVILLRSSTEFISV